MINYSGKRDLDTLSKFLDNGGVLPEEDADEEDGDDDSEDAEDESEVWASAVLTAQFLQQRNRFIALSLLQTPTNSTSRDELWRHFAAFRIHFS